MVFANIDIQFQLTKNTEISVNEQTQGQFDIGYKTLRTMSLRVSLFRLTMELILFVYKISSLVAPRISILKFCIVTNTTDGHFYEMTSYVLENTANGHLFEMRPTYLKI